MPTVRALLFLVALERRQLAEHEFAVIARLPYWLRWAPS
jgi:hypothetical protein